MAAMAWWVEVELVKGLGGICLDHQMPHQWGHFFPSTKPASLTFHCQNLLSGAHRNCSFPCSTNKPNSIFQVLESSHQSFEIFQGDIVLMIRRQRWDGSFLLCLPHPFLFPLGHVGTTKLHIDSCGGLSSTVTLIHHHFKKNQTWAGLTGLSDRLAIL